MTLSFSKSSVFRVPCSAHTETKGGVFKFHRFEEHFRELCFRDVCISVKKAYRTNKATFLKFLRLSEDAALNIFIAGLREIWTHK